MQPEGGTPLDWLLARVARRARTESVARAAAIAFACAAVATALALPWSRPAGWMAGGVVAAVLLAVQAARSRRGWTPRAAAARIERARPELRNLVITAAELRDHPDRASAWMRDRVSSAAAEQTADLAPAAVIRIGKPLAFAALALLAWVGVAAGIPQRAAVVLEEAARELAPGSSRRSAVTLTALLHPPAYTGLPPIEIENPERIEALEGTRLHLRVSAQEPSGIRVRFGDTPLDAVRSGDGVRVEVTLTESGYVAVGGMSDGGAGATLVPVLVTPDRAPAIQIDAPGKDLLLPADATHIPVTASARDDLALGSLELRYTKVSGAGEQFEFQEGTETLQITRESGREWTGRGWLSLPSLKLGPGDALVYRAVARDRRPGNSGLASSDTFFVEIQGPGQVPLEGVEMPPDQERYALSQQMVVLKIERLRARERSMAPAAIVEEAGAIAAEQRAVRANFIFLMGGHVEDEVVEAEQSHEIQEGRLENSARRDISAAIQHMTGAEQGLIAVDTAAALPPARAAVEALQRAFGRNRYILRSLSSRSPIDPSRRLTGDIEPATDWRREPLPRDSDPDAARAAALLGGVLSVAAALDDGIEVAPARLTALAEQALAMDPTSADWQAASAALLRARDALAAGRRGESASRVNEAVTPVLARMQSDARLPRTAATAPASALLRAWASEVRQ